MRETWVAHRIGPARVGVYQFAIHPESGEIIGDGPFVLTPSAPDKGEAKQLVLMANIAVRYVTAQLAEKIPLLRKEAEVLYPTQRLKLPDARLGVAGALEARMGRRKFENIFDQRVLSRKKQNEPR